MNLPSSTHIHKRLPKDAFYKWLSLTTALKDKFVSDVEHIFVENSLTMDNLRLTKESEVKEILLLMVVLKKKAFDGKIIEAIARQNHHKIVFLLSYENARQLALFHGKLYCTPWMPESDAALTANGFSLEDIWNGFIVQIALYGERAESAEGMTIDERLTLQERIVKLEKLIEKIEASAWKEQQPKKRFELYTKVQKYKQDLEKLMRNP